MEYVYASIALCMAVIGGITDFRFGRVKNKHLLYAFACWLIVLITDIIMHKGFSANLSSILLNMALSIVITFVLYIKDIWAPGDGKLFLLIALVYPTTLSPCFSGNIFPALDIVIYAFAVGYVALLISAVRKKSEISNKNIAVNVLRNIRLARIGNIISNIGFVSIIDMGLQFAFSDFLAVNRSLCTLCIIAVVYLVNKKLLVIRKIVGLIGLCAFFAITYVNALWSSMIITIIQSLVISIIVEVLNERIDKNSYRTIGGSEIKPGMILSHASIWDMQNCIDTNLPRATTETRRSRLTVTQAEAVQLWCKNAKRDVTIVEMLPFAPCIAIASLIHFIRFVTIYR